MVLEFTHSLHHSYTRARIHTLLLSWPSEGVSGSVCNVCASIEGSKEGSINNADETNSTMAREMGQRTEREREREREKEW